MIPPPELADVGPGRPTGPHYPRSMSMNNSGQRSSWPGHVPGRFYFGMSRRAPVRRGQYVEAGRAAGPPLDAEATTYGVDRRLFAWGQWDAVTEAIVHGHSRRRLPWISVGPPRPGAYGWQEVSGGAHDEALYGFGRRLVATQELPFVLSFSCDPSAMAAEDDGAHWAAAYCRFHDVVALATGMRLVTGAPLVDDWLFNPANPRQDPASWLTDAVLRRASLLGVNVFENSSGETFARRLPRVLDWLDDRGASDLMVGVAGSGRTEFAPPYVEPQRWLSDGLEWAARNTDRVAVVCYHSAPGDGGVYWPESELRGLQAGPAAWTSRAVTSL
jgi:hypothetical protein